MNNLTPQKIVCMTEESVELFHLLGRSDVIAGVSVYAKRPQKANQHPKISAFTHANINKILSLKPDLIVGFSDIQKEIAKELIGHGLDVFISNQRSIADIFKTMMILGAIIGEAKKTRDLLNSFAVKIEWAQKKASQRTFKPRVYLEEWDEPAICGISWFSELIEICGGVDIFREKSVKGSLARDRFVRMTDVGELNPDLILASWCGKNVDIDSIINRPELSHTKAVRTAQVYELPPEIYLQPGPALFVDGLDQITNLFDSLNYR